MSVVVTENPVIELLADILEGHRLFKNQGGPLSAKIQAGHPESQVVLVAGDNASGKSLLVTILAALLGRDKIEPLQVSMKYRTQGDFRAGAIYGGLGDELNSTGATSMVGVEGGLRNAENRQKRCWLLLDEPDTGLSDGYCTPMGEYLAQFGNKVPLNNCEGFVVVTHSRRLLQSMAFHLHKAPHFVCFGDYQTDDLLTAFLEDESERSMAELLGLNDRSHAMHHEINDILHSRKKAD